MNIFSVYLLAKKLKRLEVKEDLADFRDFLIYLNNHFMAHPYTNFGTYILEFFAGPNNCT